MTSGTWAFSRNACFIQGVFLGERASVRRPVASLKAGQVISPRPLHGSGCSQPPNLTEDVLFNDASVPVYG